MMLSGHTEVEPFHVVPVTGSSTVQSEQIRNDFDKKKMDATNVFPALTSSSLLRAEFSGSLMYSRINSELLIFRLHCGHLLKSTENFDSVNLDPKESFSFAKVLPNLVILQATVDTTIVKQMTTRRHQRFLRSDRPNNFETNATFTVHYCQKVLKRHQRKGMDTFQIKENFH